MCLYKCMYMCVCVCKIHICGLYVHGVFLSHYSCPLTVLKSLFSHSQSRSNCAHQCRLWVYVCSCSHSLIPSIHSFVPVSIFSLTTIPMLLYMVFVCIIHSHVYFMWYLCTCVKCIQLLFLLFFFLTCHVIVRWCREAVSSHSIRKSSSAMHLWSSSQSGCRERYCLLVTTAHTRRTCTGEMSGTS